MAKFFLGLAIVAFTSFCGFLFAKKYRKRKGFFSQFYLFNERYLNELSYYRRPLAEFSFSYSYQGEFSILLECFFEYIEKEPQAFFKVLEGEEFSFLTKEEREEVKNYFSMIGKGDSLSQKNYFLSLKERLQKRSTETESASKKYGDLFIKLGFLCGLLILILIL